MSGLPFTRWQRRSIYGIIIAFCLWGLWDVSRWVSQYGQSLPYSMPFQLFTEPWYLAADIFVGVALVCVLGFIIDR